MASESMHGIQNPSEVRVDTQPRRERERLCLPTRTLPSLPKAAAVSGVLVRTLSPAAIEPRSLSRIRAELQADRPVAVPAHGSLEAWTRRGVLLLNTTLTVDEGVSGSHWRARWWTLTDAIIEAVVRQGRPIAFLLLGKHAQAKAHLITGRNAFVVESPHPMARSKVGFANSRPFSRADAGLVERGADSIYWSLVG